MSTLKTKTAQSLINALSYKWATDYCASLDQYQLKKASSTKCWFHVLLYTHAFVCPMLCVCLCWCMGVWTAKRVIGWLTLHCCSEQILSAYKSSTHMVCHGVLKQGNYGKTPWCFETGKPWYTIQLPHTIYEKAWSTTVYYLMSWYTMSFHGIFS